ncbi:MAG TPA: SDR family NAD(P)-dependent oxidoreductase, partial [Acidimicrobiia bacterium]|nr:SDR family NAD(P)-dependent oxidoreductase [Acidimicrobiia bacterium]
MTIEGAALVTGGGAGLGEAISHRLAAEGAAVAVADIDEAAAARVAAAITDEGGRAAPVACDVTRTPDVEAAVREATELGPLRTLVLSAAIESRKSV